MKFAIIETGGKQYFVREGDTIQIEKLPDVKKGQDVSFDKVLLTDNGAETKIGTPFIVDMAVKAEVMEEGRGKKVEVMRYKAKSRYFKLRGHRQPFMKVRVTAL